MKKYTFIAVLIALILPAFQAPAQIADDDASWIEGPQDFRDSVLLDPYYFWDKKFASTVDFSGKTFEAMEFNNAKFKSRVTFTEAIFKSTVDFQGAEFMSKAVFSLVKFYGETKIAQVTFDSLDFNSAISDTFCVFENSTFNSLADFTSSTFRNRVDFEAAEFNGDVFFNFVTFDSLATFSKTEFNSDVDFSSAVLPNRLDFSYTTKIADEIDLTKATINKKYDVCYINLTGADIDKFKFRYNRFKLWFPETYIDEMTFDTIREPGYELKANVYEGLLIKQNSEGFTQSYEVLDKEYREFQYTAPDGKYAGTAFSRFWGKSMNWVDKNWWGYGYNKELIIINSLVLYLFFAFINSFFLRHLTLNVYESEKINEFWKESESSGFMMFLKAIPFSMFYTAQVFFGFKFDDSKLKYKENLQGWKIFNLLYFFLVYLTGLVCFAYLANYVVTV